MLSKLTTKLLAYRVRILDRVPTSLVASGPAWLRTKIKESAELLFWMERSNEEGVLSNKDYLAFYTDLFDLTVEDYRGIRLLDIGCGPRGSLEWANMAAERVGLDPLLDRYRRLGTDKHKMRYVRASAEAIPFDDAYFDIVTSFNSLDHVDNIDVALNEIARVLRPAGRFLLITETNHAATITEPVEIVECDLKKRLTAGFRIKSWRTFVVRDDHDIYRSIREAYPNVGPVGSPIIVVAEMIRKKAYLSRTTISHAMP